MTSSFTYEKDDSTGLGKLLYLTLLIVTVGGIVTYFGGCL